MRMLTYLRLFAVLAAFLMLAAACNGGETSDDQAEAPADGATEEEPTDATSDQGDEEVAQVDVECQVELPEDGPGSAEGMTEDPAATAASNNPELSTLVTAVQEAGLVDTLNDTEATYTIFAPANSAFEEIPEEDLNALLQDQEQLTEVLTYHVVAGEELTLQDLIDQGEIDSIQGGTVTIEAQDESTVMINGEQAEVICPNVETANATVHIIDGVLMPDGAMGGDMGSDEEMGS